jgi:hypothetical protein
MKEPEQKKNLETDKLPQETKNFSQFCINSLPVCVTDLKRFGSLMPKTCEHLEEISSLVSSKRYNLVLDKCMQTVILLAEA